jgi:hypothetical protein
MDLRQRALGGRALRVQAEAACRDQAERHDDGFVVGEHQWRQPVARAQAVAAADPALALDGNAELLQRGDVPPKRADVDVEPAGELAPGGNGLGLQGLEQCEEPSRGRGHRRSQPQVAGDNRPI